MQKGVHINDLVKALEPLPELMIETLSAARRAHFYVERSRARLESSQYFASVRNYNQKEKL